MQYFGGGGMCDSLLSIDWDYLLLLAQKTGVLFLKMTAS